MKKHIAYLLTLSIAAAAFTGCGKSADVKPEDKSQVKEENVNEENTDGEKSDPSASEVEKDETDNKSDAALQNENVISAPEIVALKKNYYVMSDDDTYTQLLKGTFMTPLLSDESAKVYPELAAAMEEDGKTELAFFDSEVEQMTADAKEWYSEAPEDYFGMYTITQGITIKRCDEKVVSIWFPVEQYSGGAHGIYGNGYTTYETATGKKLKLEDVLKSTLDLKAILKEELEKKYADSLDMFFGLDESLDNYVDGDSYTEGEGEDTKYYTGYVWALSDEGVEFYFGPYELAAYASGAQNIVLTYDEYDYLINPEYVPEKKDKDTFQLVEWDMKPVDVDGDGNNDDIYLDIAYTDDWSEQTGVEVCLNDEKVVLGPEDNLPEYFDEVKAYYIGTKEGGSYIYVLAPTYNDYNNLIIFDVSKGKLDKICADVYASFIFDYTGDDPAYKEYLFYDPECIRLANKMDIIASFSGFKSYHVGPDGKPVSDDTYYTIKGTAGWEPITCVKDFEATFIDDSGNETKDTIKSGETFKLLRTDGKTWLDAEISDGRTVRLEIEGSGMEVKVNGQSGQELFKELMYAG